jgi:asparaginyl-tRNA synthetase
MDNENKDEIKQEVAYAQEE